MQSLGAMQHFDFNDPAAYPYEQAILTIRALGLGVDSVEQRYTRTIFSVIARNQNDHVKNIAFLMDRADNWRLSPAFDVAYSYSSSGAGTRDHHMSLAGMRNEFTHDDLMTFAANARLKPAQARQAIGQIAAAVGKWPD